MLYTLISAFQTINFCPANYKMCGHPDQLSKALDFFEYEPSFASPSSTKSVVSNQNLRESHDLVNDSSYKRILVTYSWWT